MATRSATAWRPVPKVRDLIRIGQFPFSTPGRLVIQCGSNDRPLRCRISRDEAPDVPPSSPRTPGCKRWSVVASRSACAPGRLRLRPVIDLGMSLPRSRCWLDHARYPVRHGCKGRLGRKGHVALRVARAVLIRPGWSGTCFRRLPPPEAVTVGSEVVEDLDGVNRTELVDAAFNDHVEGESILVKVEEKLPVVNFSSSTSRRVLNSSMSNFSSTLMMECKKPTFHVLCSEKNLHHITRPSLPPPGSFLNAVLAVTSSSEPQSGQLMISFLFSAFGARVICARTPDIQPFHLPPY